MRNVNLYQRANGIWYFSFYRNGKRCQRSTQTTSRKQALHYLAQLNLKRVTNGRIYLQEFIRQFAEYSQMQKASKSTENDLRALNWLLQIVGNKRLDLIGVPEIEYFKQKRLERVSRTTINIDLRTCKAAFMIARTWGYISDNPFQHVQQLRLPEKQRLYLTEEEIALLLQAIREEWLRDAVVFALNTGMRRGELIHCKWKHVDLEQRLIHVVNQDNFTVKGGKSRVIPMNETVADLLSSRMPVCEYVLTSVHGRQLYPRYLRERFKDYVRELRLNPALHFHHLRHTFATRLVQRGVPIYEVKTLLGHSSVNTTQIYIQMDLQKLAGAVRRLDSQAG
ncbi:MAG TPA: site-specific integrase [bacterium]|nr:site-specific integrase [bacterium]HPG46899.1 site-specific integrase [bacterium]